MALSAMQTRFVELYLIDFNATQAYVKAGYSQRTSSAGASRLLKHPEVQQAVEARKAALAARSARTREWLVEELASEFEAAREGTKRLDKDGVEHVTRRPGDVVRIGELLARLHGWIDDKPAAPAQQLVNFVIHR